MALVVSGGSSGSAINGGTVTLTISPTTQNSFVVVTYATATKTASGGLTPSVHSSSGGAVYTQQINTSSTGTLRMSVWTYKQTAVPVTQAVCLGTGLSTSGVAAAYVVLTDDGQNPVLDVTATVQTSGGTAQPQSAAITVKSSNDVLISCVGNQAANAAVTAPTGYANQHDNNGSDTVSATVGMATITLASTAANTPPAWTGFTLVPWVGATIAIGAGSTALNSFANEAYQLPMGCRPDKMIGY